MKQRFETRAIHTGCEPEPVMGAIMTHTSLPKEVKEKLGISDELIRISVAIENVDDLIGDFEKALE